MEKDRRNVSQASLSFDKPASSCQHQLLDIKIKINVDINFLMIPPLTFLDMDNNQITKHFTSTFEGNKLKDYSN